MVRETGGRRLRDMLAVPLRRRHRRALVAALRCYRAPARVLWRYLTLRGDYPYRCPLRTPVGQIEPVLEGPHDMVTVHEVFCARTYPIDRQAGVIVDFGANIGISALYFLTEAPRSRVHLYEGNPALIARLRRNLAGFEDRVVVNELAISTHTGTTEFGVEPTGRYGGIVAPSRTETIEVPCRSALEALRLVLETEDRIDLLKIDVEGTEMVILGSLDQTLLDRVDAIAVETAIEENLLPGLYSMRREEQISHLTRIPP
jgi:FkbM family methyltransferase